MGLALALTCSRKYPEHFGSMMGGLVGRVGGVVSAEIVALLDEADGWRVAVDGLK
jgi:hypothetical protein